eukprot:TRINITY_DN6458_c0_g2_i1.p1 TRINITY_DN6458_c0_g2~~TRINITY_DN6458_c0_g2_i1.p1  ORF type:complete len:128 (+),score=15.87 TRINITY_DN6458_c0_g2_i1:156-539(+)
MPNGNTNQAKFINCPTPLLPSTCILKHALRNASREKYATVNNINCNCTFAIYLQPPPPPVTHITSHHHIIIHPSVLPLLSFVLFFSLMHIFSLFSKPQGIPRSPNAPPQFMTAPNVPHILLGPHCVQ